MKKIDAIKKIDKIWGKIFCLLFGCLGLPTSNKVMATSFLLIRPGGLGDAVLSIPSICVLKKKFPGASITVLAEKRNASVFSLCPQINNVLVYDNPRELLAAVRGKYDVVIDTEQWHRLSAVIARLIKPALSIGYATNERKKMFTHAVRYCLEEYEMDSFYHLLEPLGITQKNEALPFLNVPDAVKKNANSMLGEFVGRPYVSIFPGASIPEKRWDEKNFADLALNINMVGYPLLVIGSEKERAAGESIVRGLNALNLAGKTSLLETAALIDMSSLLVSGDSGVLHIAAGLGKPTVSLFGPSNVKKWAPKGERHVVISRNLPCSPCSKFGNTPKCPIYAKCMRDITVDEVFEAVKTLMLQEDKTEI